MRVCGLVSVVLAFGLVAPLPTAVAATLKDTVSTESGFSWPTDLGPRDGTAGTPGQCGQGKDGTDDAVALFAGGNFTVTSGREAEGRVVVGGDLIIDRNTNDPYSIGSASGGACTFPSDGAYGLIVGGQVRVTGGTGLAVGGDGTGGYKEGQGQRALRGVYGGTAPYLTGSRFAKRTSPGVGDLDKLANPLATNTRADYSSTAAELAALSSGLHDAIASDSLDPKTVSVKDAVLQYGTIVLAGDGKSDIQIFKVPASMLGSAGYSVTGVPAGATIILDVDGTPSAPIGEMWGLGNYTEHLLWNFSNASNIIFSGTTYGTILAGAGSTEFRGMVNGRVYAVGNVTQNGTSSGMEFHSYSFEGKLPNSLFSMSIAKLSTADCRTTVTDPNYPAYGEQDSDRCTPPLEPGEVVPYKIVLTILDGSTTGVVTVTDTPTSNLTLLPPGESPPAIKIGNTTYTAVTGTDGTYSFTGLAGWAYSYSATGIGTFTYTPPKASSSSSVVNLPEGTVIEFLLQGVVPDLENLKPDANSGLTQAVNVATVVDGHKLEAEDTNTRDVGGLKLEKFSAPVGAASPGCRTTITNPLDENFGKQDSSLCDPLSPGETISYVLRLTVVGETEGSVKVVDTAGSNVTLKSPEDSLPTITIDGTTYTAKKADDGTYIFPGMEGWTYSYASTGNGTATFVYTPPKVVPSPTTGPTVTNLPDGTVILFTLKATVAKAEDLKPDSTGKVQAANAAIATNGKHESEDTNTRDVGGLKLEKFSSPGSTTSPGCRTTITDPDSKSFGGQDATACDPLSPGATITYTLRLTVVGETDGPVIVTDTPGSNVTLLGPGLGPDAWLPVITIGSKTSTAQESKTAGTYVFPELEGWTYTFAGGKATFTYNPPKVDPDPSAEPTGTPVSGTPGATATNLPDGTVVLFTLKATVADAENLTADTTGKVQALNSALATNGPHEAEDTNTRDVGELRLEKFSSPGGTTSPDCRTTITDPENAKVSGQDSTVCAALAPGETISYLLRLTVIGETRGTVTVTDTPGANVTLLSPDTWLPTITIGGTTTTAQESQGSYVFPDLAGWAFALADGKAVFTYTPPRADPEDPTSATNLTDGTVALFTLKATVAKTGDLSADSAGKAQAVNVATAEDDNHEADDTNTRDITHADDTKTTAPASTSTTSTASASASATSSASTSASATASTSAPASTSTSATASSTATPSAGASGSATASVSTSTPATSVSTSRTDGASTTVPATGTTQPARTAPATTVPVEVVTTDGTATLPLTGSNSLTPILLAAGAILLGSALFGVYRTRLRRNR